MSDIPAEIKVYVLTQSMAEEFVDKYPDTSLPNIKFQGAFLKLAHEVGWIEVIPVSRIESVALFYRLQKIWIEANAVPNA